MEKKLAGTSLLWAYKLLSPSVGAAKADIWRYAVLWTYGGVCMDDDNDILRSLNEVVGANGGNDIVLCGRQYERFLILLALIEASPINV